MGVGMGMGMGIGMGRRGWEGWVGWSGVERSAVQCSAVGSSRPSLLDPPAYVGVGVDKYVDGI
jgi:hypothetical protein